VAARKKGYKPFPGPVAIISQNFDGRPACTYCGWCCGFGCPIDAKTSTLVSTIPKALSTGNFDLRPLSRVTKLNVDDAGMVKSVTYLDARGATQEQDADIFILSSYTYENVRLPLLSTSNLFPRGLANNNGMVGKYYFGHGNWAVNGIVPQKLNRYSGPQGQGIAIDDFNADNFSHTGLGFIRGTYLYSSNQWQPLRDTAVLPPDVPTRGAGYKDSLRHICH